MKTVTLMTALMVSSKQFHRGRTVSVVQSTGTKDLVVKMMFMSSRYLRPCLTGLHKCVYFHTTSSWRNGILLATPDIPPVSESRSIHWRLWTEKSLIYLSMSFSVWSTISHGSISFMVIKRSLKIYILLEKMLWTHR